jgi:lycopene cyclase domain-containing protein
VFERYLYLASLLIVLCCLVFIDRQWRLVFFRNFSASWRTLTLGLIYFTVWDACGIALHIFYNGHSRFITGLHITANFPVEELFFLLILNYAPLLLWEALEKTHV